MLFSVSTVCTKASLHFLLILFDLMTTRACFCWEVTNNFLVFNANMMELLCAVKVLRMFLEVFRGLFCCIKKLIRTLLRNIHTTRNSCREALPCANMALKPLLYFYLLMEKTLDRYLQVRSLYYQVPQYNQKALILVSSR